MAQLGDLKFSVHQRDNALTLYVKALNLIDAAITATKSYIKSNPNLLSPVSSISSVDNNNNTINAATSSHHTNNNSSNNINNGNHEVPSYEVSMKIHNGLRSMVTSFNTYYDKVEKLKDVLEKDLIPSSPEKMIYEWGLQSGREAAVDELMGKNDSALKKYKRAYRLFELLTQEKEAREQDRAILHHYMTSFMARIDLLRKISAG